MNLNDVLVGWNGFSNANFSWVPTVELVQNIWLQLVNTIKGQYDVIVGALDIVMLK